jgi:hypothetical protein
VENARLKGMIPKIHERDVFSVAIAGDGSFALTSGNDGPQTGFVRRWDLTKLYGAAAPPANPPPPVGAQSKRPLPREPIDVGKATENIAFTLKKRGQGMLLPVKLEAGKRYVFELDTAKSGCYLVLYDAAAWQNFGKPLSARNNQFQAPSVQMEYFIRDAGVYVVDVAFQETGPGVFRLNIREK